MFGEIIEVQKVKDVVIISKKHNSVFNIIGFVIIISIFIFLLINDPESKFAYLVLLPISLIILNPFRKIEIRIERNQISITKSYSGFTYQKQLTKVDFTHLDFIVAESVDLEEGREYEFYAKDKDVKIKFFDFKNANSIDYLFENLKPMTGKHLKFI